MPGTGIDEWTFIDWSYPKSKGAILVHLGCVYKRGGYVPCVIQAKEEIVCTYCRESPPDFILLTAKLNNVKFKPTTINISRSMYETYYRKYIL